MGSGSVTFRRTYEIRTTARHAQTTLSSARTDATTLAAEAQSAFGPPITALQNSLPSLDTAIKPVKGEPPPDRGRDGRLIISASEELGKQSGKRRLRQMPPTLA